MGSGEARETWTPALGKQITFKLFNITFCNICVVLCNINYVLVQFWGDTASLASSDETPQCMKYSIRLSGKKWTCCSLSSNSRFVASFFPAAFRKLRFKSDMSQFLLMKWSVINKSYLAHFDLQPFKVVKISTAVKLTAEICSSVGSSASVLWCYWWSTIFHYGRSDDNTAKWLWH